MDPYIAVVDYGLGNSGSIVNMLRKVGQSSRLTADQNELRNADGLILPGVGAFDHGMQSLARCDLLNVLNECVLERRKPVLGICLGMQLMTDGSEEGRLPGLGWIRAHTKRFSFPADKTPLMVPHMGWNTIEAPSSSMEAGEVRGLFEGLTSAARFYFVHSYHVVCDSNTEVAATAEYGVTFTAAFQKGAIFGTQFHPEKSLRFGLQVMKNFTAIAQHMSKHNR